VNYLKVPSKASSDKLLHFIADVAMAPMVLPAAVLLKMVRFAGIQRLPLCKKVLLRIGVFPIRDHYYEPLFNERYIKRPLSVDRNLPGIDWNVKGQLDTLHQFRFNEELQDIPVSKPEDLTFYFGNITFESGDAEFLYNLIRLKKPRRIFEIGSGHSTLMARKAIRKNESETRDYKCKHVCIEPFEMPWLEKTGAVVIRKNIEDVGGDIFQEMAENDLLFIDSSHVIRPQGDVLFEYLELLPSLQKGVIVHLHDIFSPRDYL
jgi:predicted O-methyltransferase YrrM